MRRLILFLLCLAFVFSSIYAQQKPEEKQVPKEADKKTDVAEVKKEKEIVPPTSMEQAKELFIKAWELEREQKLDDAMKHYEILAVYFRDLKGPENAQYNLAVLNNMAGILVGQNKYQQAVELYKGALELAIKNDNYQNIAEFYHKLGIIYDCIAKIEQEKVQNKNVITPDGKGLDVDRRVLMNRGVYTRLVQAGNTFVANRIELSGSRNPFTRQNDLYTKLVNLKVRGDFDPAELLVPDTVDFQVQVRKKGYFPISRPLSLLPHMEYELLDEKMVAIPRKVEPLITEDFYRQGSITPDEITLNPIQDGKLVDKPIQITDKERFKPGQYRLTVKKSGYNPITEHMTIYPGEESYAFEREMKSKLRKIMYRIQSDFTVITGQVVPDEISLNAQGLSEDSQVKPAEYKLVIKKEGYEPIIRNLIIEPDERPYFLTEYLKSLPREIIFQVTGDYQKDVILPPDEVTLNGRFIKYGESVKPDAFRVIVRKKGYDVDSDRIVIEPKNGPYILKRMLVSTPRRVQLHITAEFPAGLRLAPDVCTLSGRDVQSEESFKPGTYTLDIRRSGYIPIKKEVNIAPDDTPYLIREILQAKLRQVDLEITQDIPHDDPSIKPTTALKNERTGDSSPLQDKDKVAPESYLLKIEMNGYEPEVSKEVVLPSEDPYKISKRLLASPRAVVTRITSEYPEGEIVIPDEITLNNKPIGKDFKVKPGVHDLVILKEGYVPVRKQIKIGANSAEFLLAERLETRTRLVNFKFMDSYDRRELAPEEVIIGQDRLGQGQKTLNLKPGEYSLKANLKGYANLDERITIPVGAAPWNVEKFMVAIRREVHTDITGDFKPDEKLIPDVFTLNDMPLGEKSSVAPGVFNLVIQKQGYFPIIERITIRPDPKPYLLRYRMVSKPRQVNVVLKSSFNNAPINVDTLVLGNQNIKDGQNMKPGNYALLVQKKGYRPITEEIIIEPSEKPYLLERIMEALPVLVKYEITNDFDGKLITPDVIMLGDKTVDQKTAFIPGKYSMKIEKIGFTPKKGEIIIEPSESAYIIKQVLETMPRELEIMITGDFPPGERIDPEVIALNTKDARDGVFKPGKYQLDIQQPGYISLKEEIIIQPGETPFPIEKVLITKPRVVKEKVTYDVKPPEDLPAYKITLAPVDKPKQEKIVKENDLLKPGSYIMRITKEAYEPVEVKKHVWPSETPMVLEQELIAKQVVIRVNIVYDIEPPANLEGYKVSLIDKASLIPRFVMDGRSAKPGSYFLDIQRPGYSFGPKQEIDILPSEQAYHINKKLLAKPRTISFDMVDAKTNVLVSAYQILANGKPVDFKQEFQPGSEFDLVVKFLKYKTVNKRTRVVPGEGPFIESVPLDSLTRYEFSARKTDMEIDGITYEYELAADSEQVEPHLIKTEKGMGRTFYQIWVDPKAKNCKIYAGYLFGQRPFSSIQLGAPALTSIDVPRLIQHLEKKRKQDQRDYREPLEIMEKMLREFNTRRMLKQAAGTELDQLIQYIESNWKVSDPKDRVRVKMILDSIESLK